MEYQIGGVADLISQCISVNNSNVKKKSKKKAALEVEQESIVYETQNSIKKKKSSKIANEVPTAKTTQVKDYKNESTEDDISRKKKSKSKVLFLEESLDDTHKIYQKTPFPKESKKRKHKEPINSDTVDASKKLKFDVEYMGSDEKPEAEELKHSEQVVPQDKKKSKKKESKTEFEKNAERRVNHKKKKSFQNEEVDRRTVFVGNLPNSFSKHKIVKKFSKYGEIESVGN